MKVTCPDCGRQVEVIDLVGWAPFGTVPAHCLDCGAVLWCSVGNEDQVLVTRHLTEVPPAGRGGSDNFSLPQLENPVSESLPEIPVGSHVRIENRDHVLHDRHGFVVAKKHVHYRVDFGDLVVLVPEHWVRHAG